jgi:hypothetical protein
VILPHGTRCRHCGQRLHDGPRTAPENRPTRDHIVPRRWRADPVPGARATWLVCFACNQLRAELGHCPAVLAIVRTLARDIGLTNRRAARWFGLVLNGEAR